MKKLNLKWLSIVIFIIAGVLCGVVISDYMFNIDEDVLEQMSIWQELVQLLKLILLMYIVYFVSIIIHEGGHLIFGLMTGYQFSSFRIFNIMFIKQNGKIRIKKLSVAGTGGQCLMSPPELVDGRIPCVLFNMGGVILNTITSIVFIAIYLISPWRLLSLTMAMAAIMGIASALVNGIPMQSRSINNDGFNTLLLSRNKNASKAFGLQLKMNNEMTKGVRIKDMPEEWFETIDDKSDNSFITSIKVFYCNRLMDMHQFEQAKEEIKRILDSNIELVGIHKYLLICDYIYCELIDGNVAKAEELYTDDVQKFMKSMKNFPSVLRTKYTYELLHNHDDKQADKLRKIFEIVAEKYPYPKDVELEGELMDIAKYTRKGE